MYLNTNTCKTNLKYSNTNTLKVYLNTNTFVFDPKSGLYILNNFYLFLIYNYHHQHHISMIKCRFAMAHFHAQKKSTL